MSKDKKQQGENDKRERMFVIGFSVLIALFLISSLAFIWYTVASRPDDWQPAERPSLYQKTIPVEVISVDRRQGFASHIISVKVKSDEYGIEKNIEKRQADALKIWDIDKGDIVDATLYSWVMESTGEVVRRDIHGLA